ncbi:hypothetical protein GCM10007094_17190 [Pseudovibrio japonicus]|uniref:Methyltransferase type 11 domain-containing protein n=2 Tax=Pseudovibrio japonicus TaxID=366534 RepID=A0ABQ3E8A1_9HYPH|nr:hypothetical protein GCM10007094_17190 [Pseudovibrio japonicus]
MVYLDEAPVYEELSVNLGWTKQVVKEKKRREKKMPMLLWLDKKTRWRLHIAIDDSWDYIGERVRSGRVLDVGCGHGRLGPEQFTPYGIEIEKHAAAIAHEAMAKRGGRVVHAPALEGLKEFSDEYFDGIIMRSFLEHEAKPREVLEQCYKKLKKGGVVYVKVPNFGTFNRLVMGVNWCGFRFPDHLNYFDVGRMRKLAEACNYKFQLKNIYSRMINDNMHCFLTRS